MKYIWIIAGVIWVLTIPLLIISGTTAVYTGYSGLYEYGFHKYDISKVTGISPAQLDLVARGMADYLSGKNSTLQMTVDSKDGRRQLYNEKELTHMVDVRNIVYLFQVILQVSAALFVVLGIAIYLGRGNPSWRKSPKVTDNRDWLLRGLQIGAIITAGFTAILIVWAVIDFDGLFYLFHLVSFSNNLWILDPATDYLIMMFPEGFFNDVALFMVSTILAISALLWTGAFMARKKPANRQMAAT